jgi:hypothetical protein
MLTLMTRQSFFGAFRGKFPSFATYNLAIDPDRPIYRARNVTGFLYRVEAAPKITSIEVPYWFLLLMGVAGAVLAWPKERWRFSLRTLLIATALLAGFVAIAVAGTPPRP